MILGRRIRFGLAMEWVAALLIIVSVIYNVAYLLRFNYLPPPFFYEPTDTYMDWFNTSWWARNKGTYDVWTSIYPPLSFVFLRIFSLDACYFTSNSGVATSLARDCDWVGITTIWVAYATSCFLIIKALKRADRTTVIPRSIVTCLGWPMLNCLERGNLVIVTLPCFILALAPILKSARAKCFFAGLTINFKVYLISVFASLLLKRQWLRVEWILIATAVVYGVTFMILGRGTPAEVLRNLANWADPITLGNPLDVWNATTFKPLLGLLRGEVFPIDLILGSRVVDYLEVVLPALTVTTQILLLVAAVAIWLRPEAVTLYRVALIGLLFGTVSTEAGAYSMVFFIFLIMAEKTRGWGAGFAVALCYLTSISADLPLDQSQIVVRETYFRNSSTMYAFQISLTPFIRPLIIQLICLGMAIDTVQKVWRDVHLQKWSERKRFRFDAPILPWVRPPAS